MMMKAGFIATYEEYKTYAYVKLDNGKVKKMELGPEWGVGDVIEKRKENTDSENCK